MSEEVLKSYIDRKFFINDEEKPMFYPCDYVGITEENEVFVGNNIFKIAFNKVTFIKKLITKEDV